MLEKKGIKKLGFRGQKSPTGRGCGQSAQPVEEPVDRCACPVEDRLRDVKKFLSPSGLLFPVEVRSRQR